jgi:hypothetical protein
MKVRIFETYLESHVSFLATSNILAAAGDSYYRYVVIVTLNPS